MKKIIYSFLGLMLLASCQTKDKTSKIVAQMDDLKADKVMIMSKNIFNPDDYQVDTLAVLNGGFTYKSAFESVREIRITELIPESDSTQKNHLVTTLLFPQQQLHISGSMAKVVYSGSEFHADHQAFISKVQPLILKIDSINHLCARMQVEGRTQREIRTAYDPIATYFEELSQRRIEYIRQHPDRDYSVFLFTSLPSQLSLEADSLLTSRVKTGMMKQIYDYTLQRIEQRRQMQEAKHRLDIGKPAPDFTLKDINGKEFTLSSLKGKYVVLDFWGSWCGWCLKDMPQMKMAYQKHKDKVVFVGIACKDKLESWQTAVKKQNLPWLNVFDEQSSVSQSYSIIIYPSKYVIDPEGKILNKFLGAKADYMSFLDSLK